MSFGERLQALRRSNHLTQEEFAQQLKVTRQAVSKWESSKGYPEIEKIIESRTLFVQRDDAEALPVIADGGSHSVRCAMPILSEGDIIGCVVSLSDGEKEDKKLPAADVEAKLIQTAANFLGKQLES